jgi:hypothetical protein
MQIVVPPPPSVVLPPNGGLPFVFNHYDVNDWNMDTTASKVANIGVFTENKILAIFTTVRSDTDTWLPGEASTNGIDSLSITALDGVAGTITLARTAAPGLFDNPAYNDLVGLRVRITIMSLL